VKRLIYIIRQTTYTVFSFCYFIGFAIEMTVRGFFLITLGGATDQHKLQYHQILQRKAWWVINHIPGTHFSYINPKGETFEKPSVIICNHQSHIDLMAVMMLTPKLIILTKNWVWHNPIYGIVIRYADYFPITDIDEMLVNLEKKVKKGYSVMIFPEGTRSEDSKILRFHRGAFLVAEKLGLDIVPLFIKGFGDVLPKKSFHLHPGDLSLEVLPRIRRDDESEMSNYREMSRRMHRLYLKMNHEEVYHHSKGES